MKKILTLLLAACMVFSLIGCSAAKEAIGEIYEEVKKDIQFQKTGFSITLPSYAVDASKESTAVNQPYVFVVGDITIHALETWKEEYGADMTAEEYAQTLAASTKGASALSQADGLPVFTYESEEGKGFLCTAMVTDNAFWSICAFCSVDTFEKNRDTMWSYLCSAQVSATGSAYRPSAALQAVTVEDLTILIPADYTDLTANEELDLTFAYMLTENTVLMGLREDKALLAEENLMLETYAQALIDQNQLTATLDYRDGIPCFEYTSEDGQFTYLAAVFENEQAFWYLQGYSFTDTFPQVEDQLWQYLSCAKVA